jgi:hypothetical protein
MDYITGNKEFFKGIGKIRYEGKESKNPLSFKFYDENKVIGGKPLKNIFALPWLIGIPYAVRGEILSALARRISPGMLLQIP